MTVTLIVFRLKALFSLCNQNLLLIKLKLKQLILFSDLFFIRRLSEIIVRPCVALSVVPHGLSGVDGLTIIYDAVLSVSIYNRSFAFNSQTICIPDFERGEFGKTRRRNGCHESNNINLFGNICTYVVALATTEQFFSILPNHFVSDLLQGLHFKSC